MTDEEIKKTLEGFTLFMRAMSGNKELKVPKDLGEKYGVDKELCEEEENETWHGIHAQVTAPKGTFKKIFEECREGDEGGD